MKDAPKVYLARAGQNGEDEDYALENNLAMIGFPGRFRLWKERRDYDAVVKLVKDGLPDAGSPVLSVTLPDNSGPSRLRCRRTTSSSCHASSRRQIAIGRVKGPYRYAQVNTVSQHTRPVEWLRPDVPRATFDHDLLYSFGGVHDGLQHLPK